MNDSSSYCTFRVADSLYGVAVRQVKEVSALPPLTPVPHAPPSVAGLVNIRGQVHLALDPRPALGLSHREVSADCQLVLLKPALGDPCGVIVDAIGDIVTLPHDRIEPRSDSSEAKADVCSLTDDLVVGVGKTESELIIILDARRLLTGVVRTLARSGGGGTA